jgi:hypothetical protein
MLNAHALHTAARHVAGHIGPIEMALDDTFAKTASLLAYLPEARSIANLPLSTGHGAQLRLLASLNAIAQAQQEMLAAHQEFAETRADLRLPETGFGGLVPCPQEGHLRTVTSIAA